MLLLDAIKAQDTATPPGYTWSQTARRYRNAQTGRFVAYRSIYTLLDSNEEANLHVIRSLTDALYNHELGVPTWYMAVQHQLRRLHVQCAALGAGGFDQLRPGDFIRIDQKMREEMDRLIIFGEQIKAGLLSEAQISHRLTMYAGTARIQFYKAQPKPFTRPGEVAIERRRLGVADHCEWCLYLVDLGWQPYGVLPYPGETHPSWTEDSCLSACHCRMEQKVIAEADLPKWVASKQVPLWLGSKKALFLPPDIPLWNITKAWDGDKHPRHPAGMKVDPETGAGGGRFAPKESGEASSQVGGNENATRLLPKPQWQPSMSEPDAERWAADSVVTQTVQHVTYAENVDSLKQDGFDLNRSAWGRVWGDGVYVTDDKTTAEFYRTGMQHGGRVAVVVNLKIDVRNPLEVRIGQEGMYSLWRSLPPEAEQRFHALLKEARDEGDHIFKNAPYSGLRPGQLTQEKVAERERYFEEAFKTAKFGNADPDAQALTMVVQEWGYDAIHITESVFTEEVGGQQWVIFDPQKVVILDD